VTIIQILWILGLNIASYFMVKVIEKIISESPKLTQMLKYFDVNPYYALFVTVLNIGILYFILRRHKKSDVYREAYKHFTNQLSYAIGRYKGYSSNIDPENFKYTEVGVWERINEVKSARLQLLSVCGKHVRSILIGAGIEWLDDIHSFGKTAPSIMQKLSDTEFKDRT